MTAANTMPDPLPTSVPRLNQMVPIGLASIASWERVEKIAQLEPFGPRRGTEVGRGSDIVLAAVVAGPRTCKDYGLAQHLCPGCQARVVAHGHSHGPIASGWSSFIVLA